MTTAREAARREARRAAHRLQLARPSVYEALTVNDDFTDRWTDIPALARERLPLLIGGQEAKSINYRERGLSETYGLRHRQHDEATQGVLVAWNRQLAHTIGQALDDPAALGRGWIPIIEPRAGMDMLVRGVVWQDIHLRGTSTRIRGASYHRPPLRHRELWREADDRLEAWLDASPIPVVLLTDANEVGGPDVDDERWTWRGVGIDGALTNVPVPSVYDLARRRSDHRPVSIALHLGGRRVAA